MSSNIIYTHLFIFVINFLVGLAETSPFNPLKELHSLLEPSYPATGPTVSVIGISNWRLDNSKSSRALLVQRYYFYIYISLKLFLRNTNWRVIDKLLLFIDHTSI